VKELTEKSLTLFFPFAGPPDGQPVEAVDGNEYMMEDEDRMEEDPDDEPSSLILFSDQILGYKVQIVEGEIHFRAALYAMGSCTPPWPPEVKDCDDCGVFESGMGAFLKLFEIGV